MKYIELQKKTKNISLPEGLEIDSYDEIYVNDASSSMMLYLIVTDGILVAPRKKMTEWSYFHGTNPYKFIVDKRTAVDIDDGLESV